MPNSGLCTVAYLFANMYAANSGCDRQLSRAVRIEGHTKRRLGADGGIPGRMRRRVQITWLGMRYVVEG
jgi:hypothetical protein